MRSAAICIIFCLWLGWAPTQREMASARRSINVFFILFIYFKEYVETGQFFLQGKILILVLI